jgi:hypothetical protein
MARRFKKKAGLVGSLSLPGLPGIGNDETVEGDEYARFCPAVLTEVFDEAPAKKPKPKPKPAPVPPEPDPEPDEEEAEAEPPSMDWLKAELVEYAEGLGIDVDGFTKQQILDAIEEEEG